MPQTLYVFVNQSLLLPGTTLNKSELLDGYLTPHRAIRMFPFPIFLLRKKQQPSPDIKT